MCIRDRCSSVPLIFECKGTDPPLEARAFHTLRLIARQLPTSVTSLRSAHWLARDFHSWNNSWIDYQTNAYTIWLSIQQFNQLSNQQLDRLFVQLSDPYSNPVNALLYVSWKTTGYCRKDSLKLAARCPVSGCWPSCYPWPRQQKEANELCVLLHFYVSYMLLHIGLTTLCYAYTTNLSTICLYTCRLSIHAVHVRCRDGRRRQFVSRGGLAGGPPTHAIME